MRVESNRSINNGDQSSVRPISVSILVVIVLFFIVTNLIKAINALSSWDFLIALVPEVPLGYLAISGVAWSIIGIILALLLFFGRKASIMLSRVFFLLYPISYWVERLLIADGSFMHHRWRFDLIMTILIIIILFWALERRQTKEFLIQ